MKSIRIALLVATIAATPLSAVAADMGSMHMDKKSAKTMDGSGMETKTMPMTEGEIKKIDKDSGKITIKHGPIVNLGMPAMTMVFKTKDAAMLDQVKPGDKVKFIVERADGALLITQIEAAK